jgi:hypothetical protein
MILSFFPDRLNLNKKAYNLIFTLVRVVITEATKSAGEIYMTIAYIKTRTLSYKSLSDNFVDIISDSISGEFPKKVLIVFSITNNTCSNVLKSCVA